MGVPPFNRSLPMLGGIALPVDDLPQTLFEAHGLARRVHERDGVREVRFLSRDGERLLPVVFEGELHVVAWGNRRGDSRFLQTTAWTDQGSIDAGRWQHVGV